MQKPEVVNSSRKYRLRVLVCAPSNSALDEIVLRLLNIGTIFALDLQNLLDSHFDSAFSCSIAQFLYYCCFDCVVPLFA